MPARPAQTTPPQPGPSRGRILLGAGLIVAAVVAVYANSLQAPFIFDDLPGIVENQTIRHLGDLRTVLAAPSDIGSSANSRPLFNLSLALNYAAGGLNPTGYHAGNIALHALAALALFGLVRRTLLLPSLQPRWGPLARPVALGAALLWAVHPLQTETVTCVIQRTEGLVGLIYLFTCYGFIRATDPAESDAKRWKAITVAACFLGVLSKEVMATAPVLLLLYDRTFVAGTFDGAWQKRRGFHLALFASWIPLAGLILGSGGRGGTVGFGLGTSSIDYLLTQCKAIGLYLRLSFWPHPLVLDYGTDVVSGPGAVWRQGLLLLALLAGTVWALRHRPMVGFLGAWFFVILAPSSSFVPLQSQTIAEHRMYLPLAALVVPLSAWLCLTLGSRARTVLAIAVVGAGLVTIERNLDYRSTLSIWEDTARKVPENTRASINFVLELMTAGRLDEAIRRGEALVATFPDNPEIRLNHGTVLFRAGREAEGATEYRKAARLDPKNAEAHYNLGNLEARVGKFAEARPHYEAAVQAKPGHLGARMNLALSLAKTGHLAEAVAQFQEAQRRAPENPEPLIRLGNVLGEANQFEQAAQAFENALQVDPGNASAAANLAQVRRILQQRAAAR
jgi:tetratricopeptide (TPR) repeat protein